MRKKDQFYKGGSRLASRLNRKTKHQTPNGKKNRQCRRRKHENEMQTRQYQRWHVGQELQCGRTNLVRNNQRNVQWTVGQSPRKITCKHSIQRKEINRKAHQSTPNHHLSNCHPEIVWAGCAPHRYKLRPRLYVFSLPQDVWGFGRGWMWWWQLRCQLR